jgi:LAO/AO transport system kinase
MRHSRPSMAPAATPESRAGARAGLTLAEVRLGGKRALAQALAQLEAVPDDPASLQLLDDAYRAPVAHTVGLTGPPGVGKSTLTGSLLEQWRAQGRRVGVIAVDPSSKISGGALLGDRTRLRAVDPGDAGIFIRSMAARDRLGGLADLTVAAMVLMRALFDLVLIETVGVGQSETDVATVVDTVVLCIQPGSGDSLQFMKAGIIEIPDLVVVTKADMGEAADRVRADLAAVLKLKELMLGDWLVEPLGVSARTGTGVTELAEAIDRHGTFIAASLPARRRAQAQHWLVQAIKERWGREGLKRAGTTALGLADTPFRHLAELSAHLTWPGETS